MNSYIEKKKKKKKKGCIPKSGNEKQCLKWENGKDIYLKNLKIK